MKKIKKIGILVVITMLILTGCGSKGSDKFKIKVLQWAEHPALVDSLEGMKKGLEEQGVLDKVEIIEKNANEEAANAMMIANQFVSEKVDLIFAIATPSAQNAMSVVEGMEIPVVFSAVSDAKQAGLVENPDKPEGNVTGVSDLPPLEKQLDLIIEMLPETKNIGVLFNTSEVNGKNQIEELKGFAQGKGVNIVEKGVSAANEIAQAAQQLASQTDTNFIVNDNMIANATALVVDTYKKEGKPVFMAESGQFEQGVFASDSVSYLELGKQAGTMIHEILFNKTAIADLPVQTAKNTQLFVSQKMADALDIQIPASILERSEIR